MRPMAAMISRSWIRSGFLKEVSRCDRSLGFVLSPEGTNHSDSYACPGTFSREAYEARSGAMRDPAFPPPAASRRRRTTSARQIGDSPATISCIACMTLDGLEQSMS